MRRDYVYLLKILLKIVLNIKIKLSVKNVRAILFWVWIIWLVWKFLLLIKIVNLERNWMFWNVLYVNLISNFLKEFVLNLIHLKMIKDVPGFPLIQNNVWFVNMDFIWTKNLNVLQRLLKIKQSKNLFHFIKFLFYFYLYFLINSFNKLFL